ncbi:GDSL-like Lipase/Acylhydrolase [Colletotrichum graminicola]|uniref:GDSL-like Lipase/Acylhydrolase n=1 Tax=Colletotrichum graminicola (strain M1.001 / M2 / FGSC 10212) TaxID=645133 RepID=E3QRV0_COLGM|nr:GDSL-like Lipase/Acylhydrolase [Colletotrichum graminicola M1.001]EFQ33588.1 GDSL-like Lipase/Acylhydrolase [Colletotrichum graminicola M1.001]WDK10858.1 GDSL-like Lipase/Acylhydrolase [Colletotrichum graminicola]
MQFSTRALSLAVGLSLSSASPAPYASPRQITHKNLVVFGDSYSTVGFWPGGTLPAAGNPLGNPALPGQTTSSGLNWVGHLTSTLNTSLLLTYDFAVTGATTDKHIVDTYAQYCVDDQIGQYTQYVSSKINKADTLVAVWIGINDVGEPFWDRQAAPVAKTMNRYFQLLQTLVDDGLENFVLLTIPPFSDQIPAMIGQPEADLARLRSDIESYNQALKEGLAAFKSSNSSVKALVFDTRPSFDLVVNKFAEYGARDATCYGSRDCLWADNYHAGQAIHRLLAENLVKAVGGNFVF